MSSGSTRRVLVSLYTINGRYQLMDFQRKLGCLPLSLVSFGSRGYLRAAVIRAILAPFPVTGPYTPRTKCRRRYFTVTRIFQKIA